MYFDLPNVIAILLLVIISYRLGLIPLYVSLILMLGAFVPFFVNDVLFPASYMNDQFRYLNVVQSLRAGQPHLEGASRVAFAGWLLVLMPLTFVETIKSHVYRVLQLLHSF